jgi:hypothetical protein
MTTSPITLELDAKAVEAYTTASAENQKKIQLLLSLWLRELAVGPAITLSKLMDDISDKAQARGLTPETLESLLDAD